MFSSKITIIQRGNTDTSLMRLGLKSVIFSLVFDPLDVHSTTTAASLDTIENAPSVSVTDDVYLGVA